MSTTYNIDQTKVLFCWKIQEYNSIPDKIYSRTFKCVNSEWRLVLSRKRNVYLDVVLSPEELTNKQGFQRRAKYEIMLARPPRCEKELHSDRLVDGMIPLPLKSKTVKGIHVFTPRERQIYFKSILPRFNANELQTGLSTSGVLSGGAVCILCKLRLLPPADQEPGLGFVGLHNQGSTCYLSSMVQTLFHITGFRRRVFDMPTLTPPDEGDDEGSGASSSPEQPARVSRDHRLIYELQSLFYGLQTSPSPLSTVGLTKAFGWGRAEGFEQHDAGELLLLLMDALERRLDPEAGEELRALFRIQTTAYIKCVDVEYESAREETHLILTVPVKGKRTLEEGLAGIISPEIMDGQNKYRAEGHGLQRALKGMRFASLPPVMFLQLGRFDIDPRTFRPIKLQDRFAFPEVLDMAPFVPKELRKATIAAANAAATAAAASEPPSKGLFSRLLGRKSASTASPFEYRLLSVMVHSGSLNGGHYYAYINPRQSKREGAPDVVAEGLEMGQWVMLNDRTVRRVRKQMAIQGTFGGTSFESKAAGNAYMLIYVRTRDIAVALPPCPQSCLPPQLAEALKTDAGIIKRQQDAKKVGRAMVSLRVFTLPGLIAGVRGPGLSDCTHLQGDAVSWVPVCRDRAVEHAMPGITHAVVHAEEGHMELLLQAGMADVPEELREGIDEGLFGLDEAAKAIVALRADTLAEVVPCRVAARRNGTLRPSRRMTIYQFSEPLMAASYWQTPATRHSIFAGRCPDRSETRVFVKAYLPDMEIRHPEMGPELSRLRLLGSLRLNADLSLMDQQVELRALLEEGTRLLAYTERTVVEDGDDVNLEVPAWYSTSPIVVYEEETPLRVVSLSMDVSVASLNLRNSDVIVLQVLPPTPAARVSWTEEEEAASRLLEHAFSPDTSDPEHPYSPGARKLLDLTRTETAPLSVPGAFCLAASRLKVTVRPLRDATLASQATSAAQRHFGLTTDTLPPPPLPLFTRSDLLPLPEELVFNMSTTDELRDLAARVAEVCGLDAHNAPASADPSLMEPRNDLAAVNSASRTDSVPYGPGIAIHPPLVFFRQAGYSRGMVTVPIYGKVSPALRSRIHAATIDGTPLPSPEEIWSERPPVRLGSLATNGSLDLMYRRSMVPLEQVAHLRSARLVFFGTEPYPVKDLNILLPRDRAASTLGLLASRARERLMSSGEMEEEQEVVLRVCSRTTGMVWATLQSSHADVASKPLTSLISHPTPADRFIRLDLVTPSSSRIQFIHHVTSSKPRQYGFPIPVKVGSEDTVADVKATVASGYEAALLRRSSTGLNTWSGVSEVPFDIRAPSPLSPLSLREREYPAIAVESAEVVKRWPLLSVLPTARGQVKETLSNSTVFGQCVQDSLFALVHSDSSGCMIPPEMYVEPLRRVKRRQEALLSIE
eukprot:gnl/Dysnectes_brevis/4316_a5741_633.p1 GENE.gnl/Dysnectes_brevis/4316_a5741_633~~gnl/Dysnectes_brevis/4316_a5741_633.p1  ORF type:complete len:1402 (-),score=342.05 gnl/Dysnectes_brevis/4316_a5741_633:51-4256(-)